MRPLPRRVPRPAPMSTTSLDGTLDYDDLLGQLRTLRELHNQLRVLRQLHPLVEDAGRGALSTSAVATADEDVGTLRLGTAPMLSQAAKGFARTLQLRSESEAPRAW